MAKATSLQIAVAERDQRGVELKSNGKEQPTETRKPRRPSSSVTSGRRLFVDGTGNSQWARRYADLVRLHMQDISAGIDLSEAQKSLIRRAAAIEVELEAMEGKLSLGQEVDLDVFTRSASHLRRILETLGIRRVPHDVTPNLDTYLATSKAPDVVRSESQPAEVEPEDQSEGAE